MEFSLITVTYNSAATLRDTIESVLEQTYEYIQYIIVDGESTDSTISIIKEYEPKFHGKLKWFSEKDNGLYEAMNKGIVKSTGDIVGFINSDDLLASCDAIEKIVNLFVKHQVDCIYANLYYVERNNTDRIVRNWVCGEKLPFSRGWHPAHPTFYLKKEVYNKYGVFDLNYKLGADFELMLRFIEKEKITMVYCPDFLVKMRMGGITNKNLQNIIKGNWECIRAFKKNKIKINLLYPVYRLIPKIKQFLYYE